MVVHSKYFDMGPVHEALRHNLSQSAASGVNLSQERKEQVRSTELDRSKGQFLLRTLLLPASSGAATPRFTCNEHEQHVVSFELASDCDEQD